MYNNQPQKLNQVTERSGQLDNIQGYSDLLPQIVLETLNDNKQLHSILEEKNNEEKKQVNMHIDNCLKEIIKMFEALKLSISSKMDEKTAQFDSLFAQLESLSLECSNWAERKIEDVQNNFPMLEEQNQYRNSRNVLGNKHTSEKLSLHLNEIRNRKLKANAVEDALVAIDQKIDQMRLVDIAEELKGMVNQPQKLYYEQPALLVYQKIQKAVALGLKEIKMNEIVRIHGPSPVDMNAQNISKMRATSSGNANDLQYPAQNNHLIMAKTQPKSKLTQPSNS
jgi:hypothetical protein